MHQFIHRYQNYLTLISFILIVLSFIWSDGKHIALIIATIIAGIPIFMNAFTALTYKTFSIELLVTIAVIGALYIGEYFESAVVTFLFLFGAYLENRTLIKTRSSLKDLINMAPEEAFVIRDGIEMKILVDDVHKGDRVIIHSGGKIPIDGKIISGQASIDESTVTGESIPIVKKEQDFVFSGTIVDSGYIEVIAEKVGDDTTFAQIIELIEDAQESQTKTEKFLDRFANVYTPAIAILALFVYVWTKDLHMAITFLVIACPGALVIGAPVSTVSGIGNGARNGALIKGGEVMDIMAKVDTIVFDKTGTLTKGKPEVTDIKIFGDENEKDVLQTIAQAERISEHHLGQAIIRAAKQRGIHLPSDAPEGEIIKGHGIRAKVKTKNVIIGNRRLLKDAHIYPSKDIISYVKTREKEGHTVVFAAIDHQIVAVISIADQIRKDAQEAIQILKHHGVQKMIMLTGDNGYAAQAIAHRLDLDEYYAECLPQDKVKYIQSLQASGHVVAMIGDGINDAPAIATADIGLAMGEGGTDISMETADVVLMADRMTQFSHAYTLAKTTRRNMIQNIWIAIGTVLLLLIGVLKGTVHLALGMFVHQASVLLVIVNGMRLLTFRHRKQKKRAQVCLS